MNQVITEIKCYHCGDKCQDRDLPHGDKHFCCQGCKMVYEILSENNLCYYYDLDKNPGLKLQPLSSPNKFKYLDEKETLDQLLDFQDEKWCRITLSIPQIHCSSCLWLLENLYKIKEGISQSNVNFTKKELTVTYLNKAIKLSDIVSLLHSIGYAPDIKLANAESDNSPSSKKLYYQLGVAGFAFGNVMLMSLPEYLDKEQDLGAGFQKLFGWMNLGFCIPLLFYCAQDYLKSAFYALWARRVNLDVPIALGVITLFLVTVIEITNSTGSGYADSLAGLMFFLLLSKVFQQRTYRSLSFDRDFKSYFPLCVTLLTDEEEKQVNIGSIKKGDQLLIRNKELIPADCILLNNHSSIDYSFVTGESRPIAKIAGELLYAGGIVNGAATKVELIKSVSQSYLTSLWGYQCFKTRKPNLLDAFVDNVSRYFTGVILIIAVGAALYWLPYEKHLALKAFTSVLIVACPCALALAVPFSFGNLIRIFAKMGFYLKNVDVIQVLATSSTVFFDKTGTLTNLKNISVCYNGDKIEKSQLAIIKGILVNSSHPLSKSIVSVIDAPSLEISKFKEIPGKGLTGNYGKDYFEIGSASMMGLPPKETSSSVYIRINGKLKGKFLIRHQYRKGIAQMVRRLKKHLPDQYVLSGDNENERERLVSIFDFSDNLYFNQDPHEKLEFIERIQAQGRTCLMIGDGLNDAGALRQSNGGIAVVEDTNVFSPACDAIIKADTLPNLDQFIAWSKAGLRIVKAAFVLSFLYNLVGLSFAISAQLSPVIAAILMPLSSITVAAFCVGATSLLIFLENRIKKT